MITGHTKVFGVLGNPIEHTFSPFLHNMLAKETGIDMVYTAHHVKDGLLEDAIKGMKALDIQGLNVTIPYKLDVMAYMDEVKETARNVGAMNTVVRDGERLVGYNTDVAGLKRSLDRESVKLEDETILIIGAGGAARAIAVMCAEANAKHMIITNRTIEKAEALAEFIVERYDVTMDVIVGSELNKLIEAKDERVNDIKVAIQTTSVGMYPKEDANPMKDSKIYDQLDSAVDIIYNPSRTQFLAEANKAGAKTVNGLGMLFFQGLMAFELWNKIEVEESIVEKCFQAFIDKMSS